MSRDALLAAAREAARHAYAPYSKFGVGAALLLEDGSVVTGANVENASYGLSLCAETVAIAKVANLGLLATVVEVAIVGGPLGADGLTELEQITPCGRCRQMLNEAASLRAKALGGFELVVHCGGTHTRHLSELLPHAFGPADLDITP